MGKLFDVAFIGGGNMAQAMGRGIVTTKGEKISLFVVDRNPEKCDLWEKQMGAETSQTVDERLRRCKTWVLAVKPQNLKEVCLAIAPYLDKENTLVISVAAGINLQSLSRWLNHDGIIRAMPNTPSLVGMGATGLFAMPTVTEEKVAYAEDLLSCMGLVTRVDKEILIDAVCALSGSGPAYVYLFIESLIAGGVKLGLTEQQAKQLAVATVAGATKMVESTGVSPAQLRANVSSKGGTTLRALGVFQAHQFENMVAEAMQAAAVRSAEMAQELGGD